MPLDLVETLRELVAIPSVNPMGRPVSGPEYFEYRVTDYLQGLFERLGLPWQRQPVDTKRENIFVRVDGEIPPTEGGPLILLEAHQDTVPVDNMIIDPWDPVVRDGRVYGRGSCDIKGGMAAMLGAIVRLAEEPRQGRPTVVLACTVNEEHGYTGALALEKMWSQPGTIIPRRPDVAVVAEPTSLHVVRAHKACARWKCRTKGRASHSSRPHLGDNAIYRMGRVVAAIEAYQNEFLPTLPQHPRCGAATISVGTISGGISVNTVPDECVIEIDRRVLPGEEGRAVYNQVIKFISERLSKDDLEKVIHDEPYSLSTALGDEHNGDLASRLQESARTVFPESEQVGVPYGTDASVIALQGVPAVVFGPGSIDQAHTADEWLEISQLEQASEILFRFLKSW
jgi:acetylornithine deacetylase ArgE